MIVKKKKCDLFAELQPLVCYVVCDIKGPSLTSNYNVGKVHNTRERAVKKSNINNKILLFSNKFLMRIMFFSPVASIHVRGCFGFNSEKASLCLLGRFGNKSSKAKLIMHVVLI